MLSDISDYILGQITAINRHIFKNSKIKFVRADVLELPFATDRFDIVWSSGMLQYLIGEDRKRAFEEIIRVCKPGGYIMLCLPNKHDPATRIIFSRLQKIYHVKYELFTDEEIKKMFAGHRIIYLSGHGWLGYYKQLIQGVPLRRSQDDHWQDEKYRIYTIKRNRLKYLLTNKIFPAKILGTRFIVVEKQRTI